MRELRRLFPSPPRGCKIPSMSTEGKIPSAWTGKGVKWSGGQTGWWPGLLGVGEAAAAGPRRERAAGPGQRGAGAGLPCGQSARRPAPPAAVPHQSHLHMSGRRGFRVFPSCFLFFLSLALHGHAPLVQRSGVPRRGQRAPFTAHLCSPLHGKTSRPVLHCGKCRSPVFERPAEIRRLTQCQVIPVT